MSKKSCNRHLICLTLALLISLLPLVSLADEPAQQSGARIAAGNENGQCNVSCWDLID